MASYTLYTARGTCALATHIALLEADADFELRLLDFTSTEQRSPAYLALNPKGRVPALVTPNGVLTETPALLLYVAQTHPRAGLAPLDDPFLLARVQELHSYLASTVHVAHAHKHRGARWADEPAAHDSMRAKVAQNMTDCAALLEAWLEPGPWVLGDRYSVADAYLYVAAGWMDGDGVDMQRLPSYAPTEPAWRPARPLSKRWRSWVEHLRALGPQISWFCRDKGDAGRRDR